MTFVKIVFLLSIARTCLAQGSAGWDDEYFPRSQKITEVYSTSFVFAWDEPLNTTLQIEQYRILVLDCDDSLCATPEMDNCGGYIATTKNLSYTVKTSQDRPIKSRTWYKVGICAKYNSGTTYPPRIKNLQTGPAPPTNITSSSSAAGELLIKWQDDDDVTNSEQSHVFECNEFVNGYQLNYTSSGGGIPIRKETSKTHLNISDLISNAEYTITVVSTTCNDIKFSDESEPGTGITFPGKPIFYESQPEATTKSIRPVWNKPNGGEAITSYTLKYGVAGANDYTTEAVAHKVGIDQYACTIEGLVPGTNYDLSVSAENSAGEGLSSYLTRRTVPGVIQNLKAENNRLDPARKIDLTWKKPDGRGDNIQISYNGSHGASPSYTITQDFDVESCTLTVEPGNNYTIALATQSGNLKSSETTTNTTSRPCLPENIKLWSEADEILINWDVPEGYVELVVLKLSNGGTMQIASNERYHKFCHLNPFTLYTVEVYSTIVNVNGNLEESETFAQDVTTNAASPKADPLLIIGWVLAGIAVLVIIVISIYFKRRLNVGKVPREIMNSNNHDLSIPTSGGVSCGSIQLPTTTDNKKAKENQLVNNLKQAFQKLEAVGVNQSSCDGALPNNVAKNRNKSIRPYDSNRVVLASISGERGSCYINASYISGLHYHHEYIAAQGPLQGTKDDFWRMVWEQKIKIIVMVTTVVEEGEVKCESYWPKKFETTKSLDLAILTNFETFEDDWTVREFNITKGQSNRKVRHFQYTACPDHGVPETTESFVGFVRVARNSVEKQSQEPILVHSSVGGGRTGLFIATNLLLQHLQERSDSDVFEIVSQLRLQRMGMIETEEQYAFLHKIMEETINHPYEILENHRNGNTAQYDTIIDAKTTYQNTAIDC